MFFLAKARRRIGAETRRALIKCYETFLHNEFLGNGWGRRRPFYETEAPTLPLNVASILIIHKERMLQTIETPRRWCWDCWCLRLGTPCFQPSKLNGGRATRSRRLDSLELPYKHEILGIIIINIMADLFTASLTFSNVHSIRPSCIRPLVLIIYAHATWTVNPSTFRLWVIETMSMNSKVHKLKIVALFSAYKLDRNFLYKLILSSVKIVKPWRTKRVWA